MAVTISDLLCRSVALRHFTAFAAAHPLFAATGGPHGTRYVPPNGPAALYAAFDVATAHREGNKRFYQAAGAPAGPAAIRAGALRPDEVVMLGVYVRVSRLLDLRDPAVRVQLGIQAEAELLQPWFGITNAPTQVLGETVFRDGYFEGIAYPSAQNPGPGHDCLVLFPARLLATSEVHFRSTTPGLADTRLP